jgi:tetratricopeptide (TPR) repeat protein
MEQLQSALKLAPNYAPAHYHMGLALRQKGDAAQAAAEFERAHQLDPRLRPPHE